jgi:hypothetical protein
LSLSQHSALAHISGPILPVFDFWLHFTLSLANFSSLPREPNSNHVSLNCSFLKVSVSKWSQLISEKNILFVFPYSLFEIPTIRIETRQSQIIDIDMKFEQYEWDFNRSVCGVLSLPTNFTPSFPQLEKSLFKRLTFSYLITGCSILLFLGITMSHATTLYNYMTMLAVG